MGWGVRGAPAGGPAQGAGRETRCTKMHERCTVRGETRSCLPNAGGACTLGSTRGRPRVQAPPAFGPGPDRFSKLPRTSRFGRKSRQFVVVRAGRCGAAERRDAPRERAPRVGEGLARRGRDEAGGADQASTSITIIVRSSFGVMLPISLSRWAAKSLRRSGVERCRRSNNSSRQRWTSVD